MTRTNSKASGPYSTCGTRTRSNDLTERQPLAWLLMTASPIAETNLIKRIDP